MESPGFITILYLESPASNLSTGTFINLVLAPSFSNPESGTTGSLRAVTTCRSCRFLISGSTFLSGPTWTGTHFPSWNIHSIRLSFSSTVFSCPIRTGVHLPSWNIHSICPFWSEPSGIVVPESVELIEALSSSSSFKRSAALLS